MFGFIIKVAVDKYIFVLYTRVQTRTLIILLVMLFAKNKDYFLLRQNHIKAKLVIYFAA